MTPEDRATARTVLAGYQEWATAREGLSHREDDPNNLPRPDEWHDSDDAGVDYAHSLADLLGKALDHIE